MWWILVSAETAKLIIMSKKTLQLIIRSVDRILSRVYLKVFKEKNSLIVFYLHGLFRDENDVSLNLVNPQSQRNLTVEHLRQLIEYFLNCGYTFISPQDILNGLSNNRKYIMITFDDGYFNNQYALPVLKEYKVPAVFFISANHVKNYKCFWWDVLYRERIRLGFSVKRIFQEMEYLKSKTSGEIEKYIIDAFGENAFNPISDIDRPFTSSELKNFSKEKYVFLGNHTSDHAILTNYHPDEIKSQILNAQDIIYDITGINSEVIAYPGGKYSEDVIRVSKEVGLKLGFTINHEKNYLPIDLEGDSSMCLGRFSLCGNSTFMSQCEVARSDIVVYNMIRTVLLRGA